MAFARAVVLALMASVAQAFVPTARSGAGLTRMYGAGKYDGKMWDMDAKADQYGIWDPAAARSETNFNPFERNVDGNACDCSGYYPGEGPYKDPQRPNMNYAAMQAENAAIAEHEANKKAGDVAGCTGCKV